MSGRPDAFGRVTTRFFTVDVNVVLTMTGSLGAPVRTKSGAKFIHKLKRDESAAGVARRLTLQIYHARHGESDFNRPLNYPTLGVR